MFPSRTQLRNGFQSYLSVEIDASRCRFRPFIDIIAYFTWFSSRSSLRSTLRGAQIHRQTSLRLLLPGRAASTAAQRESKVRKCLEVLENRGFPLVFQWFLVVFLAFTVFDCVLGFLLLFQRVSRVFRPINRRINISQEPWHPCCGRSAASKAALSCSDLSLVAKRG